VGGKGQERLLAASLLLHGTAPLCATYLASAGLGRLLVTGAWPTLAAHDPSFRIASASPGDVADLVLDLGDGAAYRAATGARLWGGVVDGRLLLGGEPSGGGGGAVTPVLETLAAGEALRRLLGLAPHSFTLSG